MLYLENVNEISELFESQHFLLIAVFSVVNLLFAVPLSRKYMQILQQSGYVTSEYVRWLTRRDNVYFTRLAMVSMLSMLSYLIFSIAFAFVQAELIMYVGFLFYVVFLALYIRSDFRRKEKTPLVITKRVTRLYITFAIIFFLFTFGICLLCNLIGFWSKTNGILVRVRFVPLTLTPLLVPIAVLLAALVNGPMERANNRKYVEICKKTLADRQDLIKIGITGSYGKTSVKEILKSILSEKYKVLATPASYNTPMGICKTVRQLNSGHDVFIAEMGARHEGDIKELCDIVKPAYGVINGIIEHHLETFSSLEKIKKTKAELIDGVCENGCVILSCDNENTLSLKDEYKGRNIVLAGTNSAARPEVFAYNVNTTCSGTTFTLELFGEKVEVSTVLLGRHNVSNICLAAALCSKMGMSATEIAAGIARIRPIKHRLEVSLSDSGVTILDDSYNSNVSGTKAAIEVLSYFGGRKIVVTPGMVELGRNQDYENMQFGERLSQAVDFAILVGSNSYKIRDGLMSRGFPLDNVYMAKDLEDAKSWLKKNSAPGDVVLFENDLPDKFS